jgi:hypothetical protein
MTLATQRLPTPEHNSLRLFAFAKFSVSCYGNPVQDQLCRLGKCPGRTPSHARGSCLWEGHFTRRWLFRAGDAGSGSLLSVYPWNRTMPWIAGQDGGDPGRRSSVCLAMGAPFPRVTR